jgi:hypothetical protein
MKAGIPKILPAVTTVNFLSETESLTIVVGVLYHEFASG